MKMKKENNVGGVVVRSRFKRNNDILLSYNDTQTHNLIIGTTGSGKTQSYILPSILSIADSDSSMVINDPKGELAQKTSEYLKSKGYKVFIMDYFEPLAGTCFNQLFLVEEEYKKGLPHLYRAKALDAIIKVINLVVTNCKVNNLEFFQTVQFKGTRGSMPIALQNDLAKDRYTNSTAGYEVLRIDKSPKLERTFGFSPSSTNIEELKLLLNEILEYLHKKSHDFKNKTNIEGLESVLYNNEYLFYREQEVLKEAESLLESINKESVCSYYQSNLSNTKEMLERLNPGTSSYKQAEELHDRYQSTLNYLNSNQLNIEILLNYLKVLKEENEDIWIDHETAAVTYAGSIATMLVGKNDKGDKFWDQTATSMQKALILFVCRESHLPYSKHLGSVNRILANLSNPDPNTGKSALDNITDRFLPSDIVKLAMSEVRLAPDKTKGSILASASVATEIFGDYSVADQAARNDFDPETLVNEKTAVFLVSPGNDDAGTAQYTILSTLFIEEVYSALNRLLSKSEEMTLDRPVYFLLDEIANIPPIPELGSKISLARSKNMRFSLVIQSYEQLKSHYKESYDTIRENSNILYILSNNTGTAKEISERIGKTTIEVNSISTSSRDNGSSTSTSTSTTGRDLFTPQEIMQMEEGSAIYLLQRQQPYLTHLEPVYKWPIYKDLVANKVPNIHIRRHRQEVNYFCPEPHEFTVAYESLVRGAILDRYIYSFFKNMKNKEPASSDFVILDDGSKLNI
ncbi:MAG: type IV secretory system conjugative DNA transfer family protein [Erysipelotrichaceae bacterium]|nr:type IV secretory system conjugative DNA transfer family protein [Erysipelotrichaceae bacterium]